MLDKLYNVFHGKKVLILGFGREGRSTYKVLRRILPDQQLYIADGNEALAADEMITGDQNLEFITGPNYLEGLDQYDIIMKTPGISLHGHDIVTVRRKVTSQTELLLEFFQGLTIGVTGTKGKSTTSSLMYKILQDQGAPSLLLGNIGTPAFDHIDELTDEKTVVLELSSHQLEYVKHSPKIAIFLDLFEEHLDFYGTMRDYALAKANIFRYQETNNAFFYGYDNGSLRAIVEEVGTKAVTYRVSMSEWTEVCLNGEDVYYGNEKIYDARERRNLPGRYNLHNIMFVLGVARMLNLNMEQVRQSIDDFVPLKHRLEYVGEFGGVKYYDNAIATIPEATMVAIEALGDVDTILIGGKDRGVEMNEFIEYLAKSSVRNIICMPTTGLLIADKLPKSRAHVASDMQAAVDLARKLTAKGKSCLLSPAAASYDYYKNFEEKGDLYQKIVKEGK